MNALPPESMLEDEEMDEAGAPQPDAAVLDAALGRIFRSGIDLSDLAAVRLVLQGASVVDWNRAFFRDLADVDRFLALHMLNMADPFDQERLRHVHREAVDYLCTHLGLTFPPDLAQARDPREVFLVASQTGGFRRRQIQACVILKLMHVLNHMEAAELRAQTRLSEAAVLELARLRIQSAAEEMRAQGFPLVAFYGNLKTRNSVITKLLAKKENTAATVFDKLRFRLVTERRSDVVPAIAWLARHLFPFNGVIPGQSHNNLVRHDEFVDQPYYTPLGLELAALMHGEGPRAEENPFSGSGYRMVNFIADLPVRVDRMLDKQPGPTLGRSVFVMVEFQVLDRQTSHDNEIGESAHDLYKDRQRAIVESRLRMGARWRRPK